MDADQQLPGTIRVGKEVGAFARNLGGANICLFRKRAVIYFLQALGGVPENKEPPPLARDIFVCAWLSNILFIS